MRSVSSKNINFERGNTDFLNSSCSTAPKKAGPIVDIGEGKSAKHHEKITIFLDLRFGLMRFFSSLRPYPGSCKVD